MLVLIDGSLHQAHAELDELSMASDSTGGALAHMRERMREESDKLAAEIAAHQGDLGELEALRCEHGNARAALAALAALVTALGNLGENIGENLGERSGPLNCQPSSMTLPSRRASHDRPFCTQAQTSPSPAFHAAWLSA